MEGHIVRGFDGDILHLRTRVLEMGGLAIELVNRAVAALVGNDDAAAREVVARSKEVADYARAIEEDVTGLIVRRQPVATDLKLILTVGRAASDLERVGKGARKIARLAIEIHRHAGDAPLKRFYHDVRRLARLATGMLRDALDCFDRLDEEGALEVVRRDDEIDAEFRLALRELVTMVMEDQRHLGSTIDTVFVLKSLERVGDHARNIAGMVAKLARREEASSPERPVAEPASSRESRL